MSTGALPGFRDFYPAEFAERSHIFAAWRSVARRFAFAEYDGPPLEPLDLFTKKSGDEIVGQLYNFEDKGGRAISKLRSEEHTSELQSHVNLVCRLLLEKKKKKKIS